MGYDLLLSGEKDNTIINRYILLGEEDLQILPNLEAINIFVGANNSGKSWMMRHLMNMKDYHISNWLEFKKIYLNLMKF